MSGGLFQMVLQNQPLKMIPFDPHGNQLELQHQGQMCAESPRRGRRTFRTSESEGSKPMTPKMLPASKDLHQHFLFGLGGAV